MSCDYPLQARQTFDGSVFFGAELKRHGDPYRVIELPCGRCAGCRLERSRQWAMRCVHESKMWKENCFVTLTYDDEHIPKDRGLCYKDFQLFMKKLRNKTSVFRPPGGKLIRTSKKVRFYMCGEYGERNGRPHYHACLFGLDFPDKIFLQFGKNDSRIYESKILTDLWGKGRCTVGSVTFESAGYVARYVMKKITGDAATMHYGEVDKETGEIVGRTPEFNHMSLKPGIGSSWIKKYWRDVFPQCKCVVDGVEVFPPKYYVKCLSGLIRPLTMIIRWITSCFRGITARITRWRG